MHDLGDAFSTPWNAPPYPAFPIGFRDVTILTVMWRTDPAAIDALLPDPVERVGDVAVAQIYRMPDVDGMGSVNECNIMVGARVGHVAGGYSVLLMLDSDAGVAHGREVHGQPKKGGRPRLEVRGDLVVGTVERNGIDVITATLPYKRERVDAGALRERVDIAENLNAKLVPHIDGTPAVRQITARRLADLTVHECWRGPCTVELRPNAQAPVWRLPVLEPLEGFQWRADFTLVPGRVIHDYLNPENRHG